MPNFSRGGFTIIELIVVVAITAIIATVATIGLGRFRTGENVERTSEEIVAAIRSVQQKAITQEEGQTWGIRFTNATSGVPSLGTQSYTVFSGTNFLTATSKKTYTLRNGVLFSNPAPSSTKDLVFLPISGKLSASFLLIIASPGSTPFTKQISIETSGVVSTQ